MEPAKKELIEEIVDLFEDYQEDYVPGEWEAFSARRKKKAVLVPNWLKVAAVLLLVAAAVPVGLEILRNKNDMPGYAAAGKSEEPNASAEKGSQQIKPAPDKNGKAVSPALPDNAISSTTVAERTTFAATRKQPPATLNSTSIPSEISLSINSNAGQQVYTVPQKTEQVGALLKGDVKQEELKQESAVAAAKTVPLKTAQRTIDFLLSESKAERSANTERKKEKTNKWDFGIEVAPTMMKSNVNVNAGITTAYRISKSFSLSSGISMLQMEGGSTGGQPVDASSMMNVAPASSSFTSLSDKKLVAVNANIRAIDIPIGLTYNLNRNLYTNIGVSYLNIFRDKRNNTYESTSAVLRTATDPSTGQPATYQALESNETEERAADSPLKGNSYLGFFNFSVGRDQQIFGNYHFRIEPFVKVPIGRLSDQELNLMNSGIRFKLAF